MKIKNKLYNFFKKITDDLQINEFKKLFKSNNESYDKIIKTTKELLDKTQEEYIDLSNLDYFLRDEIIKELDDEKYHKKDYKCPENGYCFLLADDNRNSVKLMNNDLKYIFKQPSLIENEINNEDLIEKRNALSEELKNIKYSIIEADGDYAPFNLVKSIKSGLNIDFALLDVIFGGMIIHNNKTYILDGIDLAECILYNNQNAVIVFYTGCNVSQNSDEYNKIQKLVNKYPDQIFITDKDINDEARVEKILLSLKKFLNIKGLSEDKDENINI